jgi:hypothetical protein
MVRREAKVGRAFPKTGLLSSSFLNAAADVGTYGDGCDVAQCAYTRRDLILFRKKFFSFRKETVPLRSQKRNPDIY